MNETIYQLIKESAQREKMSVQEYIDLFSTAFRKVYCQGENKEVRLNFSLLPEKNEFFIYRVYKITDSVVNPVQEINQKDVDHLISEGKGEIKDSVFFLPLNLKNFSYDFNGQLKRNLRYLKTTQKTSLNYSSLEKLQEIISQEVPEIKEGIIKIEGILHLPGRIVKVIVSSNEERIHPLGACLGKEGMRSKTIQNRFGSEKVAFILYENDQKKTLQNIFSPIKVISWIENEEGMTVVVPGKQIYLIYNSLLQQIKDFAKKELTIVSLEELQKTIKFIIWNGNLSLEEYQQNYK